MYNINKCKDTNKLFKCIPLFGYKKLVEYAYEAKKNKIENPVDYAVFRCLKEGFIQEYLTLQHKEVQNMFVGDYNYEMDIKVQRQEAFDSGLQKGIQTGLIKGEKSGIKKGILQMAKKFKNEGLPVSTISKCTGLSEKEITKL